jgi:hypothetical protein
MRSKIMLLLSLCLFVSSQFLPALWPDMGAWNTPDKPPTVGWLITAVAWPYYISNCALVLAPLLIVLFKRLKRARTTMNVLIAFFILTPISTLAFRGVILDVAIGFWIWASSYIAAALGVVFALPQEVSVEDSSGNRR